MNFKTIAIIILFIAAPGQAGVTVQSCADAQEIADKIKDDAWTSFGGDGKTCTLTYIPKPGRTVTFTDKKTQRGALIVELTALDDKLDSTGTLTAAEQRRYMKLLRLLFVRLAKDPA